MKALILKNVVVQIVENPFPVAPSLIWVDCEENTKTGWLYNPDTGEIAPEPEPEKTQEQLIEEYKEGIQAHIDATALSRAYKNGLSCTSYLNSSVDLWKSEAQTFILWRDSVWSYVLGELNKLQNGERPVIPFDEFLKELPTIGWP